MKSLKDYLLKLDELEQNSLLYNSTYNFGGFVVQLQSSDHRLNKLLDEYFSKFIFETPVQIHAIVTAYEAPAEKPQFVMKTRKLEPGKTKLKEMYAVKDGVIIVHKIKTGVNFFFKDVKRIAHGPLVDNPNQLINFINNLKMDQLLQKHEGQIFHAAGISKGFTGMGMAGMSGKGKSTLCLKLLGDGVDYISNDRLVIDQQDGYLMMNGIPKYPRVNPGTILNQENIQSLLSDEDLEHYQSLSTEELWPIEKKYDVKIEDYYRECEFKLDAEMKYFVIINWDHDSDTATKIDEIKISDKQELLPHVMKSPGLMLPKSRSRLEPLDEQAYIDLLDQCTLYEISGKVDFDLAKRELTSLF